MYTDKNWAFSEGNFSSDSSTNSGCSMAPKRKQMMIQGHRGGFQPENTMEGFKNAVDNGLDAIELDVSYPIY